MCYSRHFILVLNVVDRILLFNQSSTCYRTDSKGIRAGIFFFFFTRAQHAAVLLGESGDCFASTIWEPLLGYIAGRPFVHQRRIAFGIKPRGGRFFSSAALTELLHLVLLVQLCVPYLPAGVCIQGRRKW